MTAHPRPADRYPWVVVPGIWDSGPEHWQSHWQDDRGAAAVRIAPASWSDPDPVDWDRAISVAVAACDGPPVLVAHSLGVLAAARWLTSHEDGSVLAAFLVAPPDPDEAAFPPEAVGFRAPTRAVTTPTALVVSDDDPYCSAQRATDFASALGARVLRVGDRQHVNVASGVGAWPEGRRLLDEFVAASSAGPGAVPGQA